MNKNTFLFTFYYDEFLDFLQNIILSIFLVLTIFEFDSRTMK